jgi:hypothetical protein
MIRRLACRTASDRRKERNPGFQGQMEHPIEDGVLV